LSKKQKNCFNKSLRKRRSLKSWEII